MGWVDHDALWCYNVAAATAERLPLGSGARYLSIHLGASGSFSVGHHFAGKRFELTIHSFSDPRQILARATLDERETTLAGDVLAWREVPRLYVEYLGFPPWKDYVLLKVSRATGQIEVQRLEWYDDTYDKDYQGVIGILELPGEDSALVAVQRSSQLILHDLETARKKGSIDLRGRGGNPALQLRDGDNEIWASDYDTLVVIRRKDRRILRSARVQGAAYGTQQFIGDYSFAPDEDICIVARPYRGDVVGIDAATLKIKRSAKLGRQPLTLAALPRGEIVARDWKTGDLLRGRLERRWFAGW